MGFGCPGRRSEHVWPRSVAVDLSGVSAAMRHPEGVSPPLPSGLTVRLVARPKRPGARQPDASNGQEQCKTASGLGCGMRVTQIRREAERSKLDARHNISAASRSNNARPEK